MFTFDKKYTHKDKFLFLDIDGVLNSITFSKESKQLKLQVKNKEEFASIPYYALDFDPKAVAYLNDIVETCNFKVVLSSTWRYSHTIEYMNELLKFVGCTFELIDYTPDMMFRNQNDGYYGSVPRGVEIKFWLDKNVDTPYEFCNYVILDDDSDMLYNQRDNFYNTDNWFGLHEKIAYQIKRRFNKNLDT